ncbi:hypothetical protein CSUI_007380 [Cystoisospora suis]|uniref:Uncharacterized protein n=1 Tax=Cystoisospora suis TaxID=483139 RepID=A0A2C6KR47_9APIC|nr:hypothetical protein CSUI_007380 [Cystoisospora suis]
MTGGVFGSGGLCLFSHSSFSPLPSSALSSFTKRTGIYVKEEASLWLKKSLLNDSRIFDCSCPSFFSTTPGRRDLVTRTTPSLSASFSASTCLEKRTSHPSCHESHSTKHFSSCLSSLQASLFSFLNHVLLNSAFSSTFLSAPVPSPFRCMYTRRLPTTTKRGIDVLEMEIREIEDFTKWLEMRRVYGEKFPRFPYDVTLDDKIDALKEKYPLQEDRQEGLGEEYIKANKKNKNAS